MTAKKLTDSILQMAIQGKLVSQDPNEEPASVLLERIREEKKQLVKKKVLKKKDIIEIPISESDKPFNLPEGWEWVRLLYISKSVVDGDHMPPPKSLSGVPFMVISNLQEDGLDFGSTMYVPIDYYNRLSDSRKAEVGDILFSVTGSYGKVILIETEKKFCFQRHMALIKPLVPSSYLLYALRSPYARSVCDDKATGMAQKTVGIDTLRKMLIPLPPIEEQIRIVKRIEEILPIIKEYGEAYEEASKMDAGIPDKLKKSILQEAIMGKLGTQDPNDDQASVLLEKIRTEKKRLVKEGKLKKKDLEENPISEDETPFKIPESWEWTRLGNHIAVTSGLAYRKDDLAIDSNEYVRVLRGGNIYFGNWSIKDDDVMIGKQFVNEDLILKKGMFISPAVTSLEQMGKTALIREDQKNVVAGGFVLMLIPHFNNENYWEFLNILFQSGYYREKCKSITNKSGQAFYNLSRAKLLDLLIPLPPLAEQVRIVDKIEKLFAEIDNMTTNNINTNINEIKETEKV